jgi:hypothetical protein
MALFSAVTAIGAVTSSATPATASHAKSAIPAPNLRIDTRIFSVSGTMINSMKRAKNRASTVREIFLKYIEATRDFTVATERCAVRVSPGQEIELRNAFALQLLFNGRDALRFECLVASEEAPEILSMKSLYEMSDRLRQGWKDVDEARLRESDPIYVDVSRQIEILEGTLDSAALEEALNAVKADSSYREARQVIAEKIERFQEQLMSL